MANGFGGISLSQRTFSAFAGAFMATMILFAAVFGFAVIDLSTELYMPGRFEPMLQINRIDEAGISFTAMGQRYFVSSGWAKSAAERLEPWRLMLPAAPQWTAMLAKEGFKFGEALAEKLKASSV
jgi:hypothetical protein